MKNSILDKEAASLNILQMLACAQSSSIICPCYHRRSTVYVLIKSWIIDNRSVKIR